MYDSAPVRPTKTNIVRSRGGCEACRERKQKCDEQKPCCNRCQEKGMLCVYRSRVLQFRDSSNWAAQKVKKVRGDRLCLDMDTITPSAFHRSNSNTANSTFVCEPPALGTGPRFLEDLDSDASELPFFPFSYNEGGIGGGSRHIPYMSPASLSNSKGAYIGDDFSPGHVFSGTFEMNSVKLDDLRSNEIFDIEPKRVTSVETLFCAADKNDGSRISHQSDGHSLKIRHSSPSLPSYISIDAESSDTTSRPSALQQAKSFSELFTPLSNQLSWVINEEAMGVRSRSLVDSPTPHNYPLLPFTSRSLETRRTDQMYMVHFMRHVVQILPLSLKILHNAAMGPEIVLYAAMALGAANMSNLHGKYMPNIPESETITWVSESLHKKRALQYTGKALSLAIGCGVEEVAMAFMAHLILLFVEAELGTYDGLRCWLEGIVKLAMLHRQDFSRSSLGRELGLGLTEAVTVLGFVAGPHELHQLKSCLNDLQLDIGLSVPSDPRVISEIGSDAVLAGFRIIVLKVMSMSINNSSQIRQQIFRQYSALFTSVSMSFKVEGSSEVDIIMGYQQSIQRLEFLSQQLGNCSPPSNIIFEQLGKTRANPAISPRGPSRAVHDDIVPLRFDSHFQAMEAADYVFAHIMCDESTLSSFLTAWPGLNPPNPWLHLLMRIAVGLDPGECAHSNLYRRGITTMLLQAGIRCNERKALELVNHILERLIIAGGSWEDLNSPIPAFQEVNNKIRQQFDLQRKIYLVAGLEFSQNWNIKNLRRLKNMLITGIDINGTLFDTCVQILSET